jgi:hypothetical protein
VNVEAAAEEIARARMDADEALGWSVDLEHRLVVFLVPDDKPPAKFPDQIGPCAVRIEPIPRPDVQEGHR